MTCLAAIKAKDKKGVERLYFAGDRRASWGFHKAVKLEGPKISFRNGVLLAGTGSSYTCDLMVSLFDVPEVAPTSHAVSDINKMCTTEAENGFRNTPKDYLFQYMHMGFRPAALEMLREYGLIDKDKQHLRSDDATAYILVGVGLSIFEFGITDSGLDIIEVPSPYTAGCGGQLAWGSLLSTESEKDPEKRLKLALQIAAKISPGCDDNIDILHN